MPVLYSEFGNSPVKELDGLTPSSYYKQFSGEELVSALNEHVKKDIPTSDFLLEVIISASDTEMPLMSIINDENEKEEAIVYALNLLNDKNSVKPLKRCLEFISWDYGESITELSVEILKNHADDIKEDILSAYVDATEKKKELLVEVLSCCKKDDRVFEILINTFLAHGRNIGIYASFLAKYGDEKALPFLYAAIDNDKIGYADFEELRFTIETLGGEYNKQRDFSFDKNYKKIVGGKDKTVL